MTTPVYRTDRATVYHCRAEDALALMPNESVDLVIADPPYGMEYQSGFRSDLFGQIEGDGPDDRERIAEVIRECVRVVGQKRHLYVFGPDDVLAGQKVSATAPLIWDKGKTGMGDLTSTWGPAHEPITFAVSFHRHGGKAGADSPAVRMRKGSVLRFSPPTGRKIRHPNEKPVPLLRELIESSSRSGDRVLDPYAGSGSTAVAAILSGRRATIVEADDRWIPLILDRIRDAERLADEMERA